MKNINNTFLITVLLLSVNVTFGQWTKITAVPNNDIIALAVHNNIIYAASDSKEIYASYDSGTVWNTLSVINAHIITSLTFFNDKIYVGTFTQGVFYSSDNGMTWQNSGTNLPVSGFAVKDNVLFASTLGNGVAVLDTNTNNWIPMNNALPSYSVNVQGIIGSSNVLMIAAGSNGTFYKYDFPTHSWTEGFYYGILRPGLQINKLINNDDTIFAVNGNRVIRSDNNGLNWADDKTGSHNGISRYIYSGTDDYYTLTNIAPTGTWIQQRSKLSAAGTTWAVNEEFQPNGYAYDILEFQNKLFLAKTDGLYMKDLSPAVYDTVTTTSNPIAGGLTSGSGIYLSNSSVTVAARANAGYSFFNWTENGNVISSDISFTFNITTNRNLTANFLLSLEKFKVSTLSRPSFGGTTAGDGTYSPNDLVTVTAKPNTGFAFFNWTDHGNVVSSDRNFTFNVASNRNLTANFLRIPRKFKVSTLSSPISGGTITGDGSYVFNTYVTVIAKPNTGYAFFNWTEHGNIISSDRSYKFMVTANRKLVANFTRIVENYTITTSLMPIFGGTTSGDGYYPSNITVTVTATPNTGYLFSNWTENGNVISYDSNYTFMVTKNRNLVAEFNQIANSTSSKVSLESLRIYPNPSEGKLFISTDTDYNLRVYNAVGQLIISDKFATGTTELDLKDKGVLVFIFEVDGQAQTIRKQLMVE